MDRQTQRRENIANRGKPKDKPEGRRAGFEGRKNEFLNKRNEDTGGSGMTNGGGVRKGDDRGFSKGGGGQNGGKPKFIDRK